VGDVLAQLPIGGLSAGALVGIIVVAILRGALVPRQQLIDKQAECDKLQAANDKLLAALLQNGVTTEKLLAGVELMNHAVADLQQMARQSDGAEP